MSKEELVYNYLLSNHIGSNNLIKNKTLRAKFNIASDKAMRKVIQNIREDKRFVFIVGSISGRSGGFFICNCEEEEDLTINNIKHRANQMLRMIHILKWKKDLRSKEVTHV